MELSGIELSGAEAAPPDPVLPFPERFCGDTAEAGTVSTPATVGDVVDRLAVTSALGVRSASVQSASFGPALAASTSLWPRST